jgi:hypothetical protein
LKVSYRSTAVVVLLVLVVLFLIPGSAFHRSRVPTTFSDGIQFNPCGMWTRVALTDRLSLVVWFATFLGILVYGLCDRRAPIRLNLISLVAFVASLWCRLPEVRYCWTNVGISAFFVGVAAVSVVYMQQQIFRRKPRPTPN